MGQLNDWHSHYSHEDLDRASERVSYCFIGKARQWPSYSKALNTRIGEELIRVQELRTEERFIQLDTLCI